MVRFELTRVVASANGGGRCVVALACAVSAALLASPASSTGAAGRIVFDVTGKDDWGSIYMMRPDGSGLRGFRFDGDHPSLSPDGTRLVFVAPCCDGVFVAGIDGRGRRSVPGTSDIHSATPRWASTGARILVDRDGDLTIFSLVNGEVRSVDPDVHVEGPDWSPDGRRIAFSGFSHFGAGPPVPIYVTNAAGTRTTNLTHPPADAMDVHARWSPDGRSVLFTRRRATSAIYTVPATGGTPRLLRADASSGAWSPDGTRIAYVDGKGHIHVLNAKSHRDRVLDVRPCRNGTWENGYCDNLDWR